MKNEEQLPQNLFGIKGTKQPLVDTHAMMELYGEKGTNFDLPSLALSEATKEGEPVLEDQNFFCDLPGEC